MFNEYTRQEFEADSQAVIEELLGTKTRAAIIEAINDWSDPIDWSDYTTAEILDEVYRSDLEAGEYDMGLLAYIYNNA